jgi:hypothetical protein
MEPSPLEAKSRRECVELLSGIPDQVGPLAAPPTDTAVVYVHGHPFLSVPSLQVTARLALAVLRTGEEWPLYANGRRDTWIR